VRHDTEPLTLAEWDRVMKEAVELGASYLDISGGEPAIYGDILGLVKCAKQSFPFVSMNSSGHSLDGALARSLRAAGLDQIILSLMSLDPGVHDRARGRTGSWSEVIDAIEAVKKSHIRLVIHFIVSVHNYRELPQLVKAAHVWQANALVMAHPEDDHEARRLLLGREDFAVLVQDVLPETIRTCARYEGHASLPDDNPLLRLYGANEEDNSGVLEGSYFESIEQARAACRRPGTFLLVYPDGTALPCNGAEYSGDPVVGNVRQTSLAEIMASPELEQFRTQRKAFCLHCPSQRHVGLGIRTLRNPPYAASVVEASREAVRFLRLAPV
jgi:radical SAM protein with 4Fe4S-binding SPASM domain